MRRLVIPILLAATLALTGCSLLPFDNDDPVTGGSDGSGDVRPGAATAGR